MTLPIPQDAPILPTGRFSVAWLRYFQNLTGLANAGVNSVSVTPANGISGTVTNPTTTPAITLALGNITPTQVASSGPVTGTNLSGTNTGDETLATIKSKLGITTLSGANTGDQDLSGLVPKTTTVNSKALSGNITLSASDVGAPSGSGTSTGANTGDQTITLTGDVTGTGAGSFATVAGRINGVAFSGLATGLLKNTTGTGAPSIAAAGADYVAPGGTVIVTSGAAMGYGAGSGGSVTQLTNKGTGVTLNTVSGRIVMNNAALAAGATAAFPFTNSAILDTDTLALTPTYGSNGYNYSARAAVANGSAYIQVKNETAGALSEAVALNFTILRASLT